MFSNGKITKKMEVQTDILRFFGVSVTYFNLIAKFDYNFFELNFHYIIVNRHNLHFVGKKQRYFCCHTNSSLGRQSS